MKDFLEEILDTTKVDNAVYSPEKNCFIFDEVYKAEDTSAKPMVFSEDQIKKSVSWRTQNYKLTRTWVDSLPSDFIVLDLGCGRLTNSNLLKNHKAIYIDGAYHEGIDVVCDFSKKLPLKSSSVDAILFSNVLEHMKEPQLIMNEISRVLKEDGELLILVPYNIKLHQTPIDFYRYTKYALEYMLNNSALTVKEIKEVGGILNIMGTLLRQAIQNEENSLYKFLFKFQYLTHRIQVKLFREGKVIESNPQGYVLYATKK